MLSIEPRNVKALLRRATAREGQAKRLGAEEDFTAVLGIEPGNKEAQAGQARVRDQPQGTVPV